MQIRSLPFVTPNPLAEPKKTSAPALEPFRDSLSIRFGNTQKPTEKGTDYLQTLRQKGVLISGGGGVMGSGIAMNHMSAGIPASLHDVKDAFVQLTFSPALQFLAGKAYKPFGLIEQTSSTRILPIERGLRVRGLEAADEYAIVNGLDYSDRDIGVQIMGQPRFVHLAQQRQIIHLRGQGLRQPIFECMGEILLQHRCTPQFTAPDSKPPSAFTILARSGSDSPVHWPGHSELATR